MLKRLFGLLGSDLAIDLGTVNTLISVPGEGIVLNEPSVVAISDDARRVLADGCAVGQLARQLLGRTPQSIQVVRPLKEGVIADFDLCEAMLRYFLRKARRRGWRGNPRVLVAVPGCITPVEKRAVYNSATRAGARQVLLVSEAKAAAIGAGLPVAEPIASMICDIGGGTTDVAVFSLADQVAGHSVRIGGDAMDRALVDYFKRQYSLRISASVAEQLRIDIGSAYPLEEELVAEVRGVDTMNSMPRKAVVTSEEVREALMTPLGLVVDAVKATLDDCPTDLAADLVDNGMVLVGGAALVRSLDRFLTEQTGVPARVHSEPLTAVARGAQICLEHLHRWRDSLESSDDDV
jgi:rod shape-determining protein MreB